MCVGGYFIVPPLMLLLHEPLLHVTSVACKLYSPLTATRPSAINVNLSVRNCICLHVSYISLKSEEQTGYECERGILIKFIFERHT